MKIVENVKRRIQSDYTDNSVRLLLYWIISAAPANPLRLCFYAQEAIARLSRHPARDSGRRSCREDSEAGSKCALSMSSSSSLVGASKRVLFAK